MSGSDHKDAESKFLALLDELRKVREAARNQRQAAARQRQRAAAWRDTFGIAPPRSATHIGDHRVDAAAPGVNAAHVVVAFAASAGGIEPLRTTLQDLPPDVPAAVLVALHTGPGSTLPAVLQTRCRLRVKFAETGETIRAGYVYVAPPEAHLAVNAIRTLTLVHKGRRQFARPSADWLFDTVAASYADCAIGVVLSGYQRDGARGVIRIRDAGGTTIAQAPETCEANAMPTAAIRTGRVSLVLPPESIAAAIVDRLQAMDLDSSDRDFDNPFAATA